MCQVFINLGIHEEISVLFAGHLKVPLKIHIGWLILIRFKILSAKSSG